MNLLHFIIFIVVSYYCAYVLDFVFTYFCKLLRKNPFGSINKVIRHQFMEERKDCEENLSLSPQTLHSSIQERMLA